MSKERIDDALNELTTLQHNNAIYLDKLDMSLEDAKENGAYAYLGKGNFSDNLKKIDT